MPAEIRLLVYEHLLDDGGHTWLAIRSMPEEEDTARQGGGTRTRRRSRYHVLDGSLHRRCYETTYGLATAATGFRTAVMATCRRVHEETAWVLYGRHSFDFGPDTEAVVPFLRDRTAVSRGLLRGISVRKQGPAPTLERDKSEWAHLCRYLAAEGGVRALRLVVEGGRPAGAWDGPQAFSARDLRALLGARHESMDWVAELARVEGLQQLEVVPAYQHCPAPQTAEMVVFAALSASIEEGLAQLLRQQLRIGPEYTAVAASAQAVV